MADLGVYLHFPWCRRRCPYCDFAIAVARVAEIPHQGYADRVLAELAERAPLFAGRTLRSIYFGGGTPALWRPDQVARTIAAVRAVWGGGGGEELEITVEANPNDREAFSALRAAGANRISIGAQAFADEELVVLGRDHDAAQALAAAASARAAGFPLVSLDLIYALPGRSLRDWRRTLERAVALAPDHLSVYQLTIEPRTPFGAAVRRGRMAAVSDDDAAEQFEAAHAALTAAGYEHYEVSSYARAGRRAVHNSLYWRGAEYLGLGNGAHSFRRAGERGVRWANHRSVVRYLADADPVAERSEQDAATVAADRVWLGLRTSDGVPRAWVRAPETAVARMVAAGLVVADAGRLRPTARGLLFADEIGATLLE